MVNQMTEEQIQEEAKLRVQAKRKFYGDFIGWASVNAVLIVIWALGDRGYLWFLWPLCIWGVFILIHYLRVFVFKQKPESLDIQEEAEKIKKEQG